MMTALWEVDLPAGSGAAAALEQAFASAVAATTTGRPALQDQPRAVLRAEILRHVRGRLGDASMSVSTVCRRFGISPRTLHATFAGGERTFAATVRRLRLERCATVLADPSTPGTITDIATSLGFGDAASFSRAFRREFGCTPSDVRAARTAQPMRAEGQDATG